MYFFVLLFHINNGDNMNMDINIKEALGIIPSSLISLLTLFIITKIIGKKQVSELSLFDYVIGISIGNFSAEMIINQEVQYINGMMAIIVFGLTAWFVNYLARKSIHVRRILMGVPTVVIEDGQILEQSLKSLNMDINDLLEFLRSEGYFHIEEVAYAIMEANGQLSVLPKSLYKPTTLKDMKIPGSKEELDSNVIIDGEFMLNNIKDSTKGMEWIKKELKKNGYNKPDDILLGVISSNKLILYPKNERKAKEVLE